VVVGSLLIDHYGYHPDLPEAWRASIIVGVSFIVALGTSVELGSTTRMLRAFVVTEPSKL
jgi:uncharacterized membrane protein YccC